jgi:hypothetical protein
MFCRPVILHGLNCITETIQVTRAAITPLKGRMLASHGTQQHSDH